MKVGGLQAPAVTAFRKYPFYQNLLFATHSIYSNNNGLQATWNKQSGNLHYGVNYTFSKALGILGAQGNGLLANPFNVRDNYNPETFDRTNVFNATYSYQVGRRVENRYLGGFVNGWEVSGIRSVTSGANLTSTYNPNFTLGGSVQGAAGVPALTLNSQTFLGTPDVTLQPRLTCNPAATIGSHRYFNSACFALPTQLGTNGNYRFPYIYGSGYLDSDLTASKNFTWHEGRDIQFRAAAFNFINRAHSSFNQVENQELHLNYTSNNKFANSSDPSVLGGLTPVYPITGYTNTKLGRRIMELSLKYTF